MTEVSTYKCGNTAYHIEPTEQGLTLDACHQKCLGLQNCVWF